MGRVLSQGEIDNMLQNLLQDSSVLPGSEGAGSGLPIKSAVSEAAEPAVPPGIAAFKAKLAAAQAARESAGD